MNDALRATFYCDHDHPSIQEVAARLRTAGGDVPRIAARTFSFVRDEIPFGFDLVRRKASQTLKRGHGVCWNKNLLLVALLRANGIPARFCSVPLRRTFIEPVVGPLHRLANDPFHHCLVQALVNDRWTILDATLDRGTYEAFFRPRGVEWGVDWDGQGDVRLYTESVVGPPVAHDDLDATIAARVGNTELPRPLALVCNRFVNRRMWKKAAARSAESAVGAAVNGLRSARSRRTC